MAVSKRATHVQRRGRERWMERWRGNGESREVGGGDGGEGEEGRERGRWAMFWVIYKAPFHSLGSFLPLDSVT